MRQETDGELVADSHNGVPYSRLSTTAVCNRLAKAKASVPSADSPHCSLSYSASSKSSQRDRESCSLCSFA